MYIGTYSDTRTTSTGNVITLNAALTTMYNGSNFTLAVETDIKWTRTGFDGSERLTITIFDASNASQVATTTVTPSTAQATYNLTYAAPTSNSCYAVVSLKWNAATIPAFMTGAWNIAPTSFNNIYYSNIKATTTDVSVTVNADCDSFQWSLDNSNWNNMTANGTTQASASITGLTVNTANTVYFRARRADIAHYGMTSSPVTTVGKAIITNATEVEIDASTPSVTITVDVYDTSYGYELGLIVNGEAIFTDEPLTFGATGTQTKTVSLTSYKSDIFAAMPNDVEVTARYIVTTYIPGATYNDGMDSVMRVTEANSAPYWLGDPSVFPNDYTTAAFFGDQDIENGLINNVSSISATTTLNPSGASARNGAHIDHYFLTVGGVTVESASYDIPILDPISASGSSIDIAYGAVDTRGFSVVYTVTAPVYAFTPIYWSATDIARQNGYDNTIEFDVTAAFDPIVAEDVGGTTHTNTVSQNISGRYSVNNGTNWTSFTLTGTISGSTLSYNGTPISGSDTPNTKNALIELTASDSLSTATLSLTVPNGVPLISFEDGKITINGDVEINGNLVVNGTITQNTPSSDLMGTTWQIKDSYTDLDCPWTTVTYNINFTSNNTNYTSLKFDNYSIYYDNTAVFYPPPPQWSNQNYRTIAITGGTDTTNADLIDWLNNYAVQQ